MIKINNATTTTLKNTSEATPVHNMYKCSISFYIVLRVNLIFLRLTILFVFILMWVKSVKATRTREHRLFQ